jgi:hypothetical protein
MEEKSIVLPLNKSTFQNIHISPKVFRIALETEDSFSYPSIVGEVNTGTEKIKAKIFTKELEDLIKKVATKKKEIQSKGNPIRLIPQSKEMEYDMLLKVYENPENKVLLTDTLTNLLSNIGFPTYLFCVLDPLSGIFEPFSSHGVTERTEKSFYIHQSNNIVKNDHNGTTYKSRKEIEDDVFLYKYFSSENFDLISGILIKKLNILKHNFLLCIVLNQEITKEMAINKSEHLIPTLEPLFPIFNKKIGFLNKINSENSDLTLSIDSYFKKKLSESSNKTIYIHKVTIHKYFSNYDRNKRKSDISGILLHSIKATDLLVESGFNKYLLFCDNNHKNQLHDDLLQKLGSEKEFHLEVHKYPEDITNIYLCF